MKLQNIILSKDEIIAFLDSKPEPVMEAELLKISFDIDRLPSGTDRLFDIHFSLYHLLYCARRPLALQGKYLHLDPMRIRLTPYPGAGQCFHYDPEAGMFCGRTCQEIYCPDHDPIYLEDKDRPSIDMLREFYLNEENISFGRSGLLEKIMNGIVVYAFKKGEIDSALGLFGIEKPTAASLARKYHILARENHPDLNGGDESRMKEINRAYQVLREVFIL